MDLETRTKVDPWTVSITRISAAFQGTDLLSSGEELSRARASYYSSDRAIRGAVDTGLNALTKRSMKMLDLRAAC